MSSRDYLVVLNTRAGSIVRVVMMSPSSFADYHTACHDMTTRQLTGEESGTAQRLMQLVRSGGRVVGGDTTIHGVIVMEVS